MLTRWCASALQVPLTKLFEDAGHITGVPQRRNGLHHSGSLPAVRILLMCCIVIMLQLSTSSLLLVVRLVGVVVLGSCFTPNKPQFALVGSPGSAGL